LCVKTARVPAESMVATTSKDALSLPPALSLPSSSSHLSLSLSHTHTHTHTQHQHALCTLTSIISPFPSVRATRLHSVAMYASASCNTNTRTQRRRMGQTTPAPQIPNEKQHRNTREALTVPIARRIQRTQQFKQPMTMAHHKNRVSTLSDIMELNNFVHHA
jgi:hypothetical protein